VAEFDPEPLFVGSKCREEPVYMGLEEPGYPAVRQLSVMTRTSKTSSGPMGYLIRDFAPPDAEGVNAVAVAAFWQYSEHYTVWPTLSKAAANTAALSQQGELVVADLDGRVVGAVGYFGPRHLKHAIFESDWAVMRMLVVDPDLLGDFRTT
jgi:hypothetical protein